MVFIRSSSIFQFLTMSLLVLFLGCQDGNKERPFIGTRDYKPVQQSVAIRLLPLGKISEQQILSTYRGLQNIFQQLEKLPVSPMPASAYYRPRNRYRADSLIQWMHTLARPGEVYIGITSLDISSTKNGFSDFGIMGLGYRPGNACVASDFRLKNKGSFFKVVIHELGHTAGLPHCPEKACFMRDAEGGDCTGEEKEFCKKCRVRLVEKGWKI